MSEIFEDLTEDQFDSIIEDIVNSDALGRIESEFHDEFLDEFTIRYELYFEKQ